MSLQDCALCRAIGETCMDCEPEVDMPPQSGHAIPQWLRDHFSAIEDNAMSLGGCAVFTQMRTKVQAYFEMLRADLSYSVVLAERNQLKAENEALSECVRIADQVLTERNKLLDLFECPAHGRCVPHAIEQVEALLKDAERYRLLRQYTVDSYLAQGSFESLDRDIDAIIKDQQP